MSKHQEAEASELGLPPGNFPTTLGDGYWHRSRSMIRNGELFAVIYVHEDEKLVVFND